MNDKLKEFEKWLRQIDLLEYYQNNPEQQQSIFNDYKSDLEYIDPKYQNEWFTLIDTDIEWVKTNYPETMKGLDERIKEWPPYVTAAHIHQIPEVFTKWKTNIDNYLKSTIDKDIRAFSKLIDLILYRLEFNSDVVNNAVNKIKPELLEMEDYLKRLLIKRPKQQTKTSYIWQANPDEELPELYSLLANEYKLISPETTLEQFTANFSGQPIEDIKPIKWHHDNASELLYFIIKLEQSNNIVHNPKKADYLKMTACFVKPDGNQFKANWKQIKQNISTNLSPDKQKAIDELVKCF